MRQISEALRKWNIVWEYLSTELSAQQLEKYGFLQAAAFDFWELATFLVKKNCTRLDTAVTPGPTGQTNNSSSTHALLERIAREQA